jgi:hypothetical protein
MVALYLNAHAREHFDIFTLSPEIQDHFAMLAIGEPRNRCFDAIMPNMEKPLSLALMICERVIVEEATKNKSLMSTFNQINAKAFPAVHPSMTVFVSVTNGNGSYPIELRISDPQDNKLLSVKGQIQFQNPTSVVEIGFALQGLIFKEPGSYSIEFYCDDELISERRLLVAQK